MKKKIRKFFTASTLTSYNDLLAALLIHGIVADITTNRKHLAVTVSIDADNEDAVRELADATKNLEVCVADENEVFMFTDDIDMASEVAQSKEARDKAMAEASALRAELNKSIESRNMYRRLYERSTTDNIRIKNQVQAIGVLLASIDNQAPGLASQTTT